MEYDSDCLKKEYDFKIAFRNHGMAIIFFFYGEADDEDFTKATAAQSDLAFVCICKSKTHE